NSTAQTPTSLTGGLSRSPRQPIIRTSLPMPGAPVRCWPVAGSRTTKQGFTPGDDRRRGANLPRPLLLLIPRRGVKRHTGFTPRFRFVRDEPRGTTHRACAPGLPEQLHRDLERDAAKEDNDAGTLPTDPAQSIPGMA